MADGQHSGLSEAQIIHWCPKSRKETVNVLKQWNPARHSDDKPTERAVMAETELCKTKEL